MNRPPLLLALLLPLVLTATAHADAKQRAASAKKSAAMLQKADMADLAMQSRIALAAFAEPELELPPEVRKYLETIRDASPADAMTLIVGLLDKHAKDYMKRACGSSEIPVVLGGPPGDAPEVIVKRCHLTPGKNAPSKLTATMRAPSLVLGGYLADLVPDANALTIARYVGHLGRKDADGKPITKP